MSDTIPESSPSPSAESATPHTTSLGARLANILIAPTEVFDAGNKLHLLLSALSIFSLWAIALMSLGLARFSRVAFWKAAVWGFALWAVMSCIPILIF